MKKVGLILILLIFALTFSQSDIEQVVVDGYGTIFQGERLIGRDAAIRDALRNAVEQVVGTMISSQSKVENMQLISDEIYSKSQGFVEKYEIISEAAKIDVYEVKIRAFVSKSGIKDKLAALRLLLVQENMPRVVVFLKQNIFGEEVYSYGDRNSMAEDLVQRELLKKGFLLVDRAQKIASIERTALQSAIDGDVNSAQRIANMYGADVIITGNVIGNVREMNLYGGYLSALVDMSLRVIKSDTGEILTTVTRNRNLGPVVDRVTGVNRALELLVPDIVNLMTDGLMAKMGSSSRNVNITLRDITFSDYGRFANFLQERIRMINKVYRRGFSSGVAQLELETAKLGEEIAEEISLRESDLPFKMEIVDVTRDTIIIKKVK